MRGPNIASSLRILLKVLPYALSALLIGYVGGPSLVVGHRYLVAGDDHFAWACGFTQAYDAAVAAQWSAALAG